MTRRKQWTLGKWALTLSYVSGLGEWIGISVSTNLRPHVSLWKAHMGVTLFGHGIRLSAIK